MNFDIDKLRSGHKMLKEFTFEKNEVEKGYAGKTLYINVGNNDIKEKSVTEEMKKIFTGGKGFNLKLMWDAVNDDTKCMERLLLENKHIIQKSKEN